MFFAACLLHGLFALTVVTPVDWDPAYYRQVALNVVEGRGAVTQSLLFYGYQPESLPFPADLHWMPLPSRVLVPGLALWTHGDQLVTVLLAAGWAPLAWALGRDLGTDGRMAGALAVFAGGYLRFTSTPDSIALYGVLGGLALLGIARERWLVAALALGLAALTRGDGLLLAPCLALPLLARRRAWAVPLALLGPAVGLAWMARCEAVAEVGWAPSRALVFQTLDYTDFVLGLEGHPSLAERAAFAGRELLKALRVGLVATAMLLPWPALWALRRCRRPWTEGLVLYGLLMPLTALILAPGVAASGSVFRSGAALFVGLCALAAVGLEALCRSRAYPRWLPALAFALASLGLGAANAHLAPSEPWTCPEGAEPVFASRPLLCSRPALLLPRGMEPEQVRALAERYGVEQAWLTPMAGMAWTKDREALIPLDELLAR